MALLALLQDLAPRHHWRLSLWHGDHRWHDAQPDRQRTQRLAAAPPPPVDRAAPGRVPLKHARQWRYHQLDRARDAGADGDRPHRQRPGRNAAAAAGSGSDLAGLAALPSPPPRRRAPSCGDRCCTCGATTPSRSAATWPCPSGRTRAVNPRSGPQPGSPGGAAGAGNALSAAASG